ncbi:hypothetical protein FQZ97_558830 [compost metagenome]
MFRPQLVQVLADLVAEGAAGLQRGVQVGDLALDQLEFADGLAELLAVVDIGNDHVHHGLHDAQRAAGQDGAFVVQAAHQHLDAAVDLAQHIFLGDFAILEHQFAGVAAAHAQLVQLLRHGKALEALFHQEGGDAALMRLGIGLGVDHQGVRVGAVGDPHFGAVQHVAVAFFLGAQLHADHVGTGARLAHGQRAHVFPGDQLGQVPGLLGRRAVAVDLVHAQVGVGAVGQADRRAGAGDFLHHDHVGEIAQVGAAVFLVGRHAQHAEFAELAPEIHRELVAAVDFCGARRDLGLREIAHRVAQHVQIFAQVEVQAGKVHRCLRDSRYLLLYGRPLSAPNCPAWLMMRRSVIARQ